MSEYAAKLQNNIVVQVIVGDSQWAAERLGGSWVPSATKVGIGWIYSVEHGLRPPQPYASWSWNGQAWQPPTPMPDDGNPYQWNEASQTWQPVSDA